MIEPEIALADITLHRNETELSFQVLKVTQSIIYARLNPFRATRGTRCTL